MPPMLQSGAKGLFQILSSVLRRLRSSAAYPGQATHGPTPRITPSEPQFNFLVQWVRLFLTGLPIQSVRANRQANGNKPLTLQQAQQYASNPPTNATLTADVTTTATQPASTDTALMPPTTKFANAHGKRRQRQELSFGYDLTAIPTNELGNAEQAIPKYITDPGCTPNSSSNGSVKTTATRDHGPRRLRNSMQALIYAATSLDLSTAAGKNQFQSLCISTSRLVGLTDRCQ